MKQELDYADPIRQSGGGDGGNKYPHGGGDDDDDDDEDTTSFGLKKALFILGIVFVIMPLPFMVGIITYDLQVTSEEQEAKQEYCSEYADIVIACEPTNIVILGWRYMIISLNNVVSENRWDLETYTWRNSLQERDSCSGFWTGSYYCNQDKTT